LLKRCIQLLLYKYFFIIALYQLSIVKDKAKEKYHVGQSKERKKEEMLKMENARS
jgi:hypothetical protein